MSLESIVPGLRDLALEWNNPHLTTYLRYFDSEFYRTHGHAGGRADLVHLTRPEAVTHFVMQGWRERRAYSRFLHAFCDPEFYRKAHPDLRLANDGAALRHWMYHGFLEGRDPNHVTAKLRRATYHVFNMAKCGSRSVVDAITRADPEATVVHAHSSVNFASSYPNCFWSYPEVVARNPNEVRFVAGVRDPFSRLIAGYLQEHQTEIASGTLAFGPDLLPRIFVEMQAALPYVLAWFDHGFHCGIDVYAAPFDHGAGFTVSGGRFRRAFVHRMEALTGLQQPLGEFLGLPVVLERRNVTVEKSRAMADFSAAAYRTIRFPADMVAETIASRFVRHFFTAAEIEALRDRWSA